MSSINTNASAMTALQSLKMTNKQLEATQNAISTGYRVASAADNAAYWSIATTMRSDNKAMSTVQDALGLGSAMVDVAYTAMNSTKDLLDEIKTKLVAAKQPGVDRVAVQAEISQLQDELRGISDAASFSGANWLSVDSSASDYEATQQIVSSFSRNGDGSISIGTISIALSGTALFDDSSSASGLLQAGVELANVGGVDGSLTTNAGTAGPPATAGTQAFAFSSSLTLDSNDQITFSVAVDGGSATEITISKATVDAALSSTDGVIANEADYASVINQALSDASVSGVTASGSGGNVTLTSATTGTSSAVAITGVSSSSNGGSTIGVMDIDISSASDTEIDSYIAAIETMSSAVTTSAADLGAIQSRIDIQSNFVSALMDAIDRGIGQLVDADMNEESTKLQALQVQQQLGIQALSIANSNSQNILSLFK
ncbi:MAG: flagellin C [Nitratireductor sp.]|nr:flagellin C [Nitratireductor sp.]